MNLETNFTKVTDFLDDIDENREKILKITREITRKCSISIKSIHRGDFDEYEQLIKKIKQDLNECKQLVNKNPGFFFKYLKTPEQEFAEAACLYAIIKEKEIPGPEGLEINALNYVLGLADVVGELRRFVLDNIRHSNLSKLDEFLNIMDDIHSNLFSLDYPSGITKDLRHKTDVARSLLEKTRGDVSLSVQMNKLKNNLKQALRKD
ncbi:MAG: haloacid dehalogenase [Promethearchaeota archaeon]|nr:MAG: haloacid dehalogenase [Candidatus Lokiarchaeota archaeon]